MDRRPPSPRQGEEPLLGGDPMVETMGFVPCPLQGREGRRGLRTHSMRRSTEL